MKRDDRFEYKCCKCNCLMALWITVGVLSTLVAVLGVLGILLPDRTISVSQVCSAHADCPSTLCKAGVCTNGLCSFDVASGCCDTSADCNSVECYRGVCESNQCVMYVHPHHYPCDDSDTCTFNDRCEFGECRGQPVVCADRPCQLGMCSSGTCVYVNADPLTNCTDDNVCTLGDRCSFGSCESSSVLECGHLTEQCQLGSCHPNFGCTVSELEGTCDDGDACTQNDVCVSGKCQGTSKNCYDNNPCTRDFCHQGQCEHVNSFEGSCIHGCNSDADCEVFSPYYMCLDNSLCGDISSNAPLIRLSSLRVETNNCPVEYGRLEIRHYMDIVHDSNSYEHFDSSSFSSSSLGTSSSLSIVESSSVLIGDIVRSYFFVQSVCERLVPNCYQFLNQRYDYTFSVKKCQSITDSSSCFAQTNYTAHVPVSYDGCPYDSSLLVDPFPLLNVTSTGSSVSVRLESTWFEPQLSDVAICIPKPEHAECVANGQSSDCIKRGCFDNLDKTDLYVNLMINGTHSSATAQDYSFDPCYNHEYYEDTICNKASRCGKDGFDFSTNILTFNYLNRPLVVDVRYKLVSCTNGSTTSAHAAGPTTILPSANRANAMGWHELERHPEPLTHVVTTELQDLVYSSWYDMQKICPGIPELRGVDVKFDESLSSGVLASASRTMLLVDGVWQSAVLYGSYTGTTMIIRVNPNVPNGWFTGTGCDTGWRYDLRTVIKHELLHGLGISSSVRANSVGYMSGDKCYVTKIDSMMVANGLPLLDGCTLRYRDPLDHVYVGGTRIYTPLVYNPGSSFSHHWHSGLLSWKIQPMTCLDIGYHELNLLQSLGVQCNVTLLTSGARRLSPIWVLGCAVALLLSLAI